MELRPSVRQSGMPFGHIVGAIAPVVADGFLAASAFAPSAGSAEAATPPKDRLSFVRDGDIYLAPLDGQRPSLLLRAPRSFEYSEPAWSNDGRRLAVTAYEYSDIGHGYSRVTLVLPRPSKT